MILVSFCPFVTATVKLDSRDNCLELRGGMVECVNACIGSRYSVHNTTIWNLTRFIHTHVGEIKWSYANKQMSKVYVKMMADTIWYLFIY